MTFFSDDMCQIDATLADQQFHSNPPILQANETCEIAFKGRRDLVLFTTKRILFVDKQGWSGKKMAYITFPYSSIKVERVDKSGDNPDLSVDYFSKGSHIIARVSWL